MDVGPAELMIVLLVVLVLFGGAKLPQLARSLGQARTEFERGRRLRREVLTSTKVELVPSRS